MDWTCCNGLLSIRFMFGTRIIFRSVSAGTGCPCSLWCYGLTICPCTDIVLIFSNQTQIVIIMLKYIWFEKHGTNKSTILFPFEFLKAWFENLTLYVLTLSEGTCIDNLCYSSTMSVHSWNPSSCKTRTYLFYIVNIMGADVLVTQGARTSATMILA